MNLDLSAIRLSYWKTQLLNPLKIRLMDYKKCNNACVIKDLSKF